jgi:hypothetical protein
MQQSPELASNLIESHLEAMRLGSRKAVKLFPNLLSLIEDVALKPHFSSALNKFAEKSDQVPAWLFLPWINQVPILRLLNLQL